MTGTSPADPGESAIVSAGELCCYVVNLGRRPDRRARIAAQLPPGLEAVYTSDWDGPFDGRTLTLDQLDRAGYRLWPWQIDSDNPWWSRPLKYGEIGCTLSHLACWRDAAERDAGYALVLEDDAVLATSFLDTVLVALTRLGTPPPFELLYLGRFPLTPDRPAELPDGHEFDGVVTPGYSHCTFAYLLTGTGLQTVIAARLESAIVPVDEFLPALYHQHPRPDLHRRFPPRMRALAFDPPLVTQRDKADAGSDTEDSAFITDPARRPPLLDGLGRTVTALAGTPRRRAGVSRAGPSARSTPADVPPANDRPR